MYKNVKTKWAMGYFNEKQYAHFERLCNELGKPDKIYFDKDTMLRITDSFIFKVISGNGVLIFGFRDLPVCENTHGFFKIMYRKKKGGCP